MPTSLFNSIASWILKKRIHQMELFMKYTSEVQEELLSELINKAQDTEVGIRYGFESIKNYSDFREQVPLSTYESIAPQIEQVTCPSLSSSKLHSCIYLGYYYFFNME